MPYQPLPEKKKYWRENIPVSTASCKRFAQLKEAKEHAKDTSLANTETRHVIHAGDYYFSSTTAQVFWYERLIISYCNGQVASNRMTEKDLEIIYYEK